MLKRLIGLIIFGVLAALLASWLSAQTGRLHLEWFGWRIDMPTSLGVAVLIVLALFLLLADRLIRGILRLPSWVGQTVAQRRDASGHKALTLGFMAVSAGETREAMRQANRAGRLLNAPHLTDLLSAQAAHLAGDHRAARRYFTALTNDSDTAFLGHVGLTRLALDSGDEAKALVAARNAQALKPKSVMAAKHLFALETKAGNWDEAADVIDLLIGDAGDEADDGVSAGASDSDREWVRLTRQKSALYFLLAQPVPQSASQSSEWGDGASLDDVDFQYLRKSLAVDPGFRPAVLALADFHLANDARRKAVKVLEAGFKACPNGTIAARLKRAWDVNDGAFIAKLIKLVGQVTNDLSLGRLVAAQQAFAVGLIGEARSQLDAIDPADRDAPYWQLTAKIASDENDDAGAAVALGLASDAARPHSWQCASCHSLHAHWQAHCPDCGSFGDLEWRRPGHVTPLGLSHATDSDATDAETMGTDTRAHLPFGALPE
ncbi:hypothetical protein N8835_05405 [Alphaproteobacteria bacterium]|nr:hypothetical protein [Alphaproteobacteria bacterium]